MRPFQRGPDSGIDRRVGEPQFQFVLEAPVADAPRFAHEGHLHWRQGLFRRGPRDARRSRQAENVGDTIEILAHPEIGVIDHVVGAVAAPVAQCRDAGGRQVVGMDMVGEYVVASDQRRQALLQALHRQSVGGIDAGRAQDGNSHAGAPAPGAQAALGIDATAGARTRGTNPAGLVDARAGAIAINASGTNVNQAAW
jgi:hypothetical protein